MSKRWYAVQAFSGYEKIVQKGLLERISQSEISDQFGEILVPVEEVVEMKSGQKKVTFEVGESIRVVDGPFKDFAGTVDTIDYEKSKLRVSVVIFGRATPVELEFGQIEKEI